MSSNSLNRLLRIVPWVKKNIFYSILKMNLKLITSVRLYVYSNKMHSLKAFHTKETIFSCLNDRITIVGNTSLHVSNVKETSDIMKTFIVSYNSCKLYRDFKNVI